MTAVLIFFALLALAAAASTVGSALLIRRDGYHRVAARPRLRH